MTLLTPQLDAELRKDAPTIFGAVAIDLPGYQISLLDGAGEIPFGGRTYVGEDATFGALADIDSLTDGTGDEAPAISIGLIPASDAAAAVLAAPGMQGSPVRLYLGAVNVVTGMPIPDPHLVFAGEIDVPALESGEDGRRLEYDVVSVFERLFEDDQSARLSPGFHRSIFAGEAGLDYVTGVDQSVYWGIEGGQSGVVPGVPGLPGGEGLFGGGPADGPQLPMLLP